MSDSSEGHQLNIEKFTVGPFQENSYLLRIGRKCILVDPGFYSPNEFKQFLDVITAADYDLEAVVLTHAHIDHVLGLQKVLDWLQVPVYLNHSDLTPWNRIHDQASMFGFHLDPFHFTPEPLAANSDVTIGSFRFKTLFTPGHSPDHVSLYFQDEDKVISGDVIFKEGVGRTDLYGGDFSVLEHSIKSELYVLPDRTELLPGHGSLTTVGHEKLNNPYVRQ